MRLTTTQSYNKYQFFKYLTNVSKNCFTKVKSYSSPLTIGNFLLIAMSAGSTLWFGSRLERIPLLLFLNSLTFYLNSNPMLRVASGAGIALNTVAEVMNYPALADGCLSLEITTVCLAALENVLNIEEKQDGQTPSL